MMMMMLAMIFLWQQPANSMEKRFLFADAKTNYFLVRCVRLMMMMMMMMLVMFNVQYNDELLLHGVMTKGSQYDEHLKKQKHAGPANRV